MNKYIFVAIALVAGLLGGYFASHSPALFGANNQVTAYNALNEQPLLSELNLIANPLISIDQYSSSSFVIASLANGPSTSTITSSTAGTQTTGSLGDPVVGDIVIVASNATSVQQKGVVFTGSVVSTGTIMIEASQPTSTTSAVWTGGSVPVNVTVLPTAGFKAPTGL